MLSREEAQEVIDAMEGVEKRVIQILYGVARDSCREPTQQTAAAIHEHVLELYSPLLWQVRYPPQ